jgi:ribosome biogenesis GTPase
LDGLGFDDRMAPAADEARSEGLVVGRVVRVDRGQPLVDTGELAVRAEPSSKLMAGVASAEDLPAVGDWVALRADEAMDVAMLERVLPRHSAISRRDPKKATDVQVLAANVDVVFVVHALSGDPRLGRLERELVAAWEGGAEPVIVLNKADLCDDSDAAVESVRSVAAAVPIVLASATEGQGIDEVSAQLGPGRTAVLLGPSGGGKSTIVNRMVGEDVRAVGEVRARDQKGRHTTVARELIRLPDGGLVIDSPGLRAFALWLSEEGFAQAFTDIHELAADCRFRDCAHDSEPGCAVRAAVEDGSLDARRLESYHRLDRELEYLESKHDERLRAERVNKWKQIHRSLRHHPKYQDRR